MQGELVGETGFGCADWLVLVGYFLVLAVSGVWLARRKQKDATDYFLANRTMPAWAVAISVLATAQSAATFIGAPQSAYQGNLTYLSANIGQILAALIVAAFFIPVLYRCGASTVYELLEVRVGGPARAAASWMFMVGRVMASGARLFMGGLAGAMILFGDIEPAQVLIAIAIMTVVGILYTLAGGIRSVIWTDVIQALVYIGAAGAALVVLLRRIPVSIGTIVDAWQSGMPDGSSKLQVVTTGFETIATAGSYEFLTHWYTLWTAFIGFTLLNLGFYGTDQDAMQRMLTCRSAARGAWSMIGAVLLGIPVTLLFMVVGLLLWVLYERPDLMGTAGPTGDRSADLKVFLLFIVREMPPGLGGLMMAGLMAAGLSSLNSALNALGSSFVSDFYRRRWPNRGEDHFLWVGRAAVAVSGVLVGCFAVFCVYWHRQTQIPLIDFALLVMAFAYAGLVAVFLTILFTRRGNNFTVIAALLCGFLFVMFMQSYFWNPICSGLAGLASQFGAEPLRDRLQQYAGQPIALPWQLTLAVVAAMLICCAGRRQPAANCHSTQADGQT